MTMALEQKAMSAQIADNKRRDWMAFGLIGMSLVASGIFAYLNMPWLSGGTFATMVGYVALGFFKWRKNA